MRKLNWTFLVGLTVGTLILGVGTYFVHGFQVKRNSSALLDRARKSESEGNLVKAADALKQFLALEDSDAETWRWYSRLIDESSKENPRRRVEALTVNREALRHLPDDPKLERRCAEIAIDIGDAESAIPHLNTLIGHPPGQDSRKAEAKDADLYELRGDALRDLKQYDSAAADFETAKNSDPARVSAYRKLAEVRKTHLRQGEKADETIKEMVALNENNGLAHLYQYLYRQQFQPPGRKEDLDAALRLKPEDNEVLLAAASYHLSQGKPQDLEEARTLLEKGSKQAPGDAEIALRLASLERIQGHPDRSRELLRSAFAQKPDWRLAYELCSTEIDGNHLDGEDGARAWAEKIRSLWGYEPIVKTLQGRIKMQEADWAGAIQEIQAAITEYKNRSMTSSVPALERLEAECHRRLGHEDQYRATLDRAVNSGLKDPQSQLELARILLNSDRPGDRDRAFQMLQIQAIDNPEIEVEIADLMIRRARASGPGANWKAVEDQLAKARSRLQDAAKYPRAGEALTLLEAEKLAALGRTNAAMTLLTEAGAKSPTNLRYRLALARLDMRDDARRAEAIKVLDQAERDLGPHPDIFMARLEYWGQQGGDRAKAEVVRLAESVKAQPADTRPACLLRLARTELVLGDRTRAREHFRELAGLQPGNLEVVLNLFDLALEARDDKEVKSLIDRLFDIENPGSEAVLTEAELEARRHVSSARGAYWRYAEAALLLQRMAQNAADSTAGVQDRQRVGELAEAIEVEQPMWWGGPLLRARLLDLTKPENLQARIEEYRNAFDRGRKTSEVVGQIVSLMEKVGGKDAEIASFTNRVRSLGGNSDALKAADSIRAINQALEEGKNDEVRRRAQELLGNSSRYIDRLELARYLQLARDVAGAEQEYLAAIQMAPAAPECRLRYVEFLSQAGRREKALAVIQEASTALPADQAPLTLAACLATVGDIARAEAMTEKALATPDPDAATLRFAAQFYIRINKPTKAMTYLDQLAEPAPGATLADVALANRLRADLLARSGQPKDLGTALEMIERNLQTSQGGPLDTRIKAVILAEQGKSAEAIRLFTGLKQEKKLQPADQYILARLYLGAKDGKSYEAEIKDLLQRAGDLDRQSEVQLLAQYTSYLLNADRLDEAETQLKRLTQRDPQGLATLSLRVASLKARNGGKPTPEIRKLLLEQGGASPEQLAFVADLLAQNGFTAEAEEGFNRYVREGSNQPQRELALAAFLATVNGRAEDSLRHLLHAAKSCLPEQVATASLPLYDAPSVTEAQRKAVEDLLTEAVKRRPDLIMLANKLNAIRIRKGQIDEAEAEYRRLLVQNPSNPEALNNLAWMLAMQGGNKTDEALEKIQRAIQIQGENPSLLDTKAVALIQANKHDEAIEVLTQAFKSAPSNSSIPLHLAWAKQKLGKKDEAQKAFKQALELGWTPDRSDPMERKLMIQLRNDLGL